MVCRKHPKLGATPPCLTPRLAEIAANLFDAAVCGRANATIAPHQTNLGRRRLRLHQNRGELGPSHDDDSRFQPTFGRNRPRATAIRAAFAQRRFAQRLPTSVDGLQTALTPAAGVKKQACCLGRPTKTGAAPTKTRVVSNRRVAEGDRRAAAKCRRGSKRLARGTTPATPPPQQRWHAWGGNRAGGRPAHHNTSTLFPLRMPPPPR